MLRWRDHSPRPRGDRDDTATARSQPETASPLKIPGRYGNAVRSQGWFAVSAQALVAIIQGDLEANMPRYSLREVLSVRPPTPGMGRSARYGPRTAPATCLKRPVGSSTPHSKGPLQASPGPSPRPPKKPSEQDTLLT